MAKKYHRHDCRALLVVGFVLRLALCARNAAQPMSGAALTLPFAGVSWLRRLANQSSGCQPGGQVVFVNFGLSYAMPEDSPCWKSFEAGRSKGVVFIGIGYVTRAGSTQYLKV
jgi:hypothetical protein